MATWNLPTVVLTPENAGTQKRANPYAEREKREQAMAALAILKKNAYEESFQKGSLEGKKQITLDMQGHVTALRTLLKNFEAQLQATRIAMEEQIQTLVIAATQAVLHYDLTIAPQHITHVVCEALDLLPQKTEHLTIHLHPEDLPWIHSMEQALDNAKIIADPTLTRGGCHIHADYSHINATLEHRLFQVLEQLHGS
jgi:flagellar assembly protein FliH